MNSIPYLTKGDTVVIIAPAKSIQEEYISMAISLFLGWGLYVETGKHILGKHHYFSGTDTERANDLQWALNHPVAKAIICARGGYGTIRITDKVSFSQFSKNPKWLVGFSDITILHHVIHQLHLPSIHGTVPFQFNGLSPDSETFNTLHNALFGQPFLISFASHPFSRYGNVEAQIVGGNLAIMVSLIGTQWDIDLNDKILLIEEVSEYAYKLDRMMWSLRKSGKLDRLAGLVVGGLTDIKECEEVFGCTVQELIFRHVSQHAYPVAFGLPVGHQPDNRAIILGMRYRLVVEEELSKIEFC